MTIRVIQKPYGTLEILVYLYKNKKATATDMINNTKLSREGCYSALQKLENLGLAFGKKEIGWPTYVYYQLTSKGEKVASYLIPVDEIVTVTINGFKEKLSMLENLEQTTENKKERLDILSKLYDICFTLGEWDDALAYSKKALELSGELNSVRDSARAYLNIGNIFLNRNDYGMAKHTFQQSLNFASKIKDFQEYADLHYSMAVVFEHQSNYGEALKHYQICEKYGKKKNNKLMIGKAFIGIGKCYAKKGEYAESIELLKESVKILEEIEDLDELAKSCTSLGATYFYVDMDEAIRWHERCIEISEKIGNLRMLGYGLSSAAGCYKNKGEYKKSVRYLERALKIFERLDEKKMISNIFFHYGSIYQLQKAWDKSIEYFTKSIDILTKLNTPYRLAIAYGQFGIMYKDKGDSATATEHLTKALDIFKGLGNKTMIERIENELEGVKIR